VRSATSDSSSGDEYFDRRVAECFGNLPTRITAKHVQTAEVSVPVYFYAGIIALRPTTPAPRPIPMGRVSPAWPAGAIAPGTTGRPHTCQEEDLAGLSVGIGEVDDVMLGFTVTEQGTVRNVSVLSSSGNAMADSAALQCVLQWAYRPATQNGVPIAVPWKAIVKIAWNPDNYDSALVALYSGGMSCVRGLPNDQSVQSPTARTDITMHVSDGAVTDFSVSSVSGNPVLDSRASDCFAKAAPAFVNGVKGSRWVVFVIPWKSNGAVVIARP